MIEIRDLRKRLGRREVLQGITLKIGARQRIALIGSNGAGKTTLIRCLLGEYDCRGDIRISGRDPRGERTEVLGEIAFVPQLPPPLKMPVAQLVGYVAKLCNSPPERISEIASRLGFNVDKHRHQLFVRLSGGQKQKLLIATALGRPAKLLILDEPAANLDPEARATFFRLLAERQDEAAMLISSHRLDEVATLVNRVIELDQGKVILDDQVADQIALASRLSCRIKLVRAEPAFARAVAAWGFRDVGGGTRWEGTVAGPDRLRFLGMLSRYVGLLAGLELNESVADARSRTVEAAHG